MPYGTGTTYPFSTPSVRKASGGNFQKCNGYILNGKKAHCCDKITANLCKKQNLYRIEKDKIIPETIPMQIFYILFHFCTFCLSLADLYHPLPYNSTKFYIWQTKKSLAAVKRRGISLVKGLFKLDEPV